ncbi:ribonuclease HII [Clostridium putrefaciens]|uniref:Ribonuclease HII n=1 Tax=Clostridium putrefaciens TaxID=99675 RepID=A0A381J7K3_9CLOT|nr:ribonuclease HII [Clostridium putrefaciens]SUY47264.1 ribonuclease HII [Clostridium putrefaciens]
MKDILINENFQGLSVDILKGYVNSLNFYNLQREDVDFINKKLELDNRKSIQNLAIRFMRGYENYNKELKRIEKLYMFDKGFEDFKLIAGVDEVGRGPLAGPIVSAAVILDLDVINKDMILYLNDSKKLTEAKREHLSNIIKSKALAYSISFCSNSDIDEKGIGFCNNEVFKKAVYSLDIKPNLILSDGYTIKGFESPNIAVIKGDAKSASIAAASIIAKVYRDNLMKEQAEIYPHYDFDHNVGYGTRKHIEAIEKYGATSIHRVSFLNNIIGEKHL